MDIFTKYNLKPVRVLQVIALVLVAVLVLSFVTLLAGTSLTGLFSRGQSATMEGGQVFGLGGAAYDNKMAADSVGAPELSIRNVRPQPSTVPGSDAENFEVKEYYSTIETRQLEETCAVFTALKAKSYVIVDGSNLGEHNCTFTFKVQKDHVEEILAVINQLDPKELSANIYTIKQVVNDYTSELEILENKKTTIEATLANAIKSYDDITALATRIQDVESLAKIIDSKINIIERLTQERLLVSEQLDRISRAKAEQLDRLEYTYFYVTVLENKYIDGESLKDSWKAAVQEFVQDVNRIAQEVTVGLGVLLLMLLQLALYIAIIVVAAKYGWQAVRTFWTKK